MLSVEKAQYIEGYKIWLMFNNGQTGVVNLKQTLFNDKRAIFLKLKDMWIFKAFKLAHSSLVWLDEVDLAPEYLFFLAFMNESEFQEQFRQWGYIN